VATSTEPGRALNLHDYEAMARAILPPAIFGFVAGGSGDEAALVGNREAFARWRFLPRVLRGVVQAETVATVLGTPVTMPVLLAPMGGHRLVHPEGEAVAARAIKRAGSISILSTASTVPMEEVAPHAGPWWFQLYVTHDRRRCEQLVRRAEAACAQAIVLTVDVPKLGRREAEHRHGFALPAGVTFPHLLPDPGPGDTALPDEPGYYQLTGWDASIGWADLAWLVELTDLPVIVKGVLHPDDAREAVRLGAKGLIVSNHGGRQLDYSVGSLDALPAVVAAVGDAAEVYLDGGVRRGTDVIKALALGATAVCVGRPFLWAVATGGEEGLIEAFELLRNELALDLLLCGKAGIGEIGRELLVPVGVVGGE
jgi:4-hydroxymandelate oxidase